MPPTPAPQGVFTADLRGVHYTFLKDRVPAWFNQATAQRQAELANHALQLPDGYVNAGSEDRATLADAHNRYREALNQVDRQLGSYQDVLAFAEPLLKEAIKARFNQDLDVRTVYFARKYGFKHRDDLYGFFVFDQPDESALSYEYRGVTLLDAALANFAAEEAQPSPCTDCQYLTTWRSYGGDVVASTHAVASAALPIAPHDFAQLCRNLDLGRQYQQHLKTLLQPEDKAARQTLHNQLQDLQRHQFALSVESARLIDASISADLHRALRQWLEQPAMARLDGKPLTVAAMNVLGIDVHGPLLIGPERQGSDRVERLVMYIPGDPVQPLKEYASSGAAMDDLRNRLHSGAYRQFFSRCVPQRQQGVFFASLQALYHPDGDGQADYPQQPRPARLPVTQMAMPGEIWATQREGYINKALADARAVAVPTDDEDREARLARLDSFLTAANSVFNLAAFVVPGLGPIMLTVGASQMFGEAFDGIHAYEQGDVRTMWAHFSSVALNAAMLKTGAQVLPEIQLSPLVDRLHPVRLPDGGQRLWNPDLTPYRQLKDVPEGSQPDALGLHRVDDRQVLRLDGQVYAVQRDPLGAGYRVAHPTRADVYMPRLQHNGRGAWSVEGEQPHTWEGRTLMRRLGHEVAGYTDAELEQIRRISATDANVLRRLHVEGAAPPPLLADTLVRFEAYRWVERFAERLSNAENDADVMTQLHVLTHYARWPLDVSLRVVDAQQRTQWQFDAAPSTQGAVKQLTISEQELKSRLLESVLEKLDPAQTHQVLEQHPGTPLAPLAERAQALRRKLGEITLRHQAKVFNDCYESYTGSRDPRTRYLKGLFPRVPDADIDTLLRTATPEDRAQIERWDFADKQQTKPIPLRLAEQLRWIQPQVRLTRAREGLYLEALMGSDSETLALHSLQNLAGWPEALRIEVREGGFDGTLRAAIGADTDPRKVLVHQGGGRYQAFDHQQQSLHASDSFYAALQHALPDAHRRALGVPDVSQHAQMKTLIGDHALPRETLGKLLKIQAPRVDFQPPVRWADGQIGYPLSGRGAGVSHLHRRVLRLYPTWELRRVEAWLGELGETAEQQVGEREQQLFNLKQGLDQWLRTDHSWTARDGMRTPALMSDKQATCQLLLNSWQRRSTDRVYVAGEYLNRLKIRGFAVPHMPELPADAFAHIDILDLREQDLVDLPATFLRAFPNVQRLNLGSNRLQSLPGGVESMAMLEDLRLPRNQLVLNSASLARLHDCQALRYLDLSQNPNLGLTDVSRLAGLRELGLRATDLHAMPEGVAELAQLELLDLRYNQIRELAAPLQGPFDAPATVARRLFVATDLDGNPLSAMALEQYALAQVQLAVAGQAPGGAWQPAEPPAPLARSSARLERWLRDVPSRERAARSEQWAALNRELSAGEGGPQGAQNPPSEPFFRLLEQLVQTDDYRDAYASLGARVWALLDVMADSEVMREQLFELASDPRSAEDGAALLFSRLDVRRLSDAGSGFVDDDGASARLVKLAKGLFRLQALDRFAQQHADTRFDAVAESTASLDDKVQAARAISRADMRVAYRAGLKDDLGLPGQPSAVAAQSGVSPADLQRAKAAVTALDDSPEQFKFITGCGFWRVFLKRKYGPQFDAATDPLFTQVETLDAARPAMSPEEYQIRHAALMKEIDDVEEAYFRTLTLQELAL